MEGWLPGILPYGDRLAIGRLLNHTSGVPDYIPPVYAALYQSPAARLRSWAPRDLVGRWPTSHRGRLRAPGRHPGGIPGFLCVALSTSDGRRQLALMVNVLNAPAPVYEALIDAARALGGRLLAGR